MSGIGQGVKLHALPGLGGPTSIEEHPDEDVLVLTCASRHVTVYNVKSQRPSCSWSVKSGQRISCPAVAVNAAIPAGDKYMAVVNKQVIRTWANPNDSIEKGAKLDLPKPVHRLFRRGDLEPVVVYEDGTLSLTNKLDVVFGEGVVKDKPILWCGCQELGEVLYVTVLMVSGSKLQLHIYKLTYTTSNDHEVNLQSLTLEKVADQNPVNCCLHVDAGQVFLITLWANGQVCKTGVSNSDINTVELHKMQGIGKASSIVSLGPAHLAVCNIRENDQAGVGIWDLKFGILQSWNVIPDTDEDPDQLQIYLVHKHLILVCRTAIYEYKYQLKQPTLGDSLGKFSQKPCSESLVVGTSAGVPENLRNILEELDSVKVIANQKLFTRELNKCLKLTEKNKAASLILQPFFNKLVLACLSRTKFWLAEEIHQLIKLGLVPGSLCDVLFKALVDHSELVILHSCLSHIKDIPESALLLALNFFLETSDEKFSSVTDEEMIPSEEYVSDDHGISCPFGKPKAAFVNKILLLPYNDVFLLENLRKLDFMLTLDLMNYLQYLLTVMSWGSTMTPREHRDLTMLQVVDWICMLLDTHFTHMILSSEARKILVDLHQVVESQVSFFDELVSLEGLLSQLKEKCALPKNDYPGLYSIQTLHVY